MKILLTPCTFQEISVDRSNKACRLNICREAVEGRVLLPLLRREVTHGLYVGGIDTPPLVTIGFPTSCGCTGSGMGALQDEKEVVGGKNDIR